MDTPLAIEKADSSSVCKLLRQTVQQLECAGVDSPLLDAELVLAWTMGTSRMELLSHPEVEPNEKQVAQFRRLVELRAKRMPLAYILGCREFYGIDLEVTPAVLIPRPETETVVDAVAQVLRETPDPVIADLGVGSGAIAVSLAIALPRAHVSATECSSAALEVARRNIMKHGVGSRVELLLGNLFEPLEGRSFDAVVSNPPYVPTAEISTLQPEIARYEPRGALDGGPDGLDYYRRIVPKALDSLKPGGTLLVEVGAGQSALVQPLFRRQGYTSMRTLPDYSGIERVVLGCRSVDS